MERNLVPLKCAVFCRYHTLIARIFVIHDQSDIEIWDRMEKPDSKFQLWTFSVFTTQLRTKSWHLGCSESLLHLAHHRPLYKNSNFRLQPRRKNLRMHGHTLMIKRAHLHEFDPYDSVTTFLLKFNLYYAFYKRGGIQKPTNKFKHPKNKGFLFHIMHGKTFRRF